MKKTILAIATIITLTVGNGFAQRYKSHEVPAIPNGNSRVDNSYEELQINKLDNIVKLTRKQENQIKKIENKYDRLAAGNRRYRNYQSLQRLEQEKQREIISVLTPVQRQRLFAYQNAGKRYNWRG
jgi:Spy/CpxP family protein refolding chaperone